MIICLFKKTYNFPNSNKLNLIITIFRQNTEKSNHPPSPMVELSLIDTAHFNPAVVCLFKSMERMEDYVRTDGIAQITDRVI